MKFCFSLRSSYKELILCANYLYVNIHSFRKRWSFIWGCFFSLWIFLTSAIGKYLIKYLKFDTCDPLLRYCIQQWLHLKTWQFLMKMALTHLMNFSSFGQFLYFWLCYPGITLWGSHLNNSSYYSSLYFFFTLHLVKKLKFWNFNWNYKLIVWIQILKMQQCKLVIFSNFYCILSCCFNLFSCQMWFFVCIYYSSCIYVFFFTYM